jgi:hypothetical protein
VSIAVRPARPDDYETLCALFNELGEFHRQARPDFFRPFDGPARTTAQVERWCDGPSSTVLVAEGDGQVVGLEVLLTCAPSAFAGAATAISSNSTISWSGPIGGAGRQGTAFWRP